MTCFPGPGRSAGPGPPTPAASHRLRRRSTRRVKDPGDVSSPAAGDGFDPSGEALDDGCLFPVEATR